MASMLRRLASSPYGNGSPTTDISPRYFLCLRNSPFPDLSASIYGCFD